MSDRILKFKEELDENITNGKLNKELRDRQIKECNYNLYDGYPMHSFYLGSERHFPGMMSFSSYPNKLIILDEEDIAYFKNKYLNEDIVNRLISEKQEKEDAELRYDKELSELKKKYNKDI